MPAASFETFGTQHLVVIGLTLAVPAILSAIARSRASQAVTRHIAWTLAGVLLTNEIAHWVYRLSQVGWLHFAQSHLPAHVCGIAALATVATLLFRHQRSFEIAYFWGLVGTANAVITPGEMTATFPEYRFVQYFTTHSGIVAGALFATWGMRMRPTLASVGRAFVWLQVLAVGACGLNLLLGSNYMYLCAPPSNTESPFFFLPWPWYIPWLELVGLALFLVVYLPFLKSDWRASEK